MEKEKIIKDFTAFCYDNYTIHIVDRIVKDYLESLNTDEPKECEENCDMNYCDENGCVNRKRHLVSPTPLNNDLRFYQSKKERFCSCKGDIETVIIYDGTYCTSCKKLI